MRRKAFNTGIFKMLLLVLLFANIDAFAQKTTVWVIRHAEKDESNPDERDPVLKPEGKQRAVDLAKRLDDEKLAAVFSTNYKRTVETVTPLAQHNKLTVQHYPPTDFAGLAKKILTEYKGQTVAVAGHSNTITEIVKAFGTTPVPAALKDDDYDFLYKVVIDETGKATVTAEHYGEKHHSTD